MSIPSQTVPRTRFLPPKPLDSPAPSTRTDDRGQVSASALLRLAGCFGLLFGFLEVAALLIVQYAKGPWTLGHLQLNAHFPWMIPATQFAIFTTASMPIAALAFCGIRVRRRLAYGMFLAIGVYSLVALVEGLHDYGAIPLSIGVATTLSSLVSKRHRIVDGWLSVGYGLQALTLVAVAAVCYDRNVLAEKRATSTSSVGGAHPRQNVLLIVLDTVSAKHLSVYNPKLGTTPNLARLAARGVVFENARSTAPWTFPSHASLFTGRWPHELGIADETPLDDSVPTLAEYFSSQGYATAGFVANTYYCNSWFGLGRGFVRYEDRDNENILVSPVAALETASLGRKLITTMGLADTAREGSAMGMKDAARLRGDFLGWLDNRPRGHFFAFLNFMDAHDPYFAAPSGGRTCGICPETRDDEEFLRGWHQSEKTSVTDRQKGLAENSYHNCLQSLDEQLGTLFDMLERRSILDDTLVVITADHGEAFGEHGLYLHGQSVYASETHVPLIVLNPKSDARRSRIAPPVSLRDVAATIVDELDLTSDSPFPGRSLARFWTSEAPIPSEQVAPILIEGAVRTKVSRNPDRVPAQRGPLSAVIDRGWTYIVDAMGREELYDQANDPGEASNLAADPGQAGRLTRLRESLRQLLDPDDAGD